MSLFALIRQPLGIRAAEQHATGRGRRRRLTHKPRLEVLEDRRAPAVTVLQDFPALSVDGDPLAANPQGAVGAAGFLTTVAANFFASENDPAIALYPDKTRTSVSDSVRASMADFFLTGGQLPRADPTLPDRCFFGSPRVLWIEAIQRFFVIMSDSGDRNFTPNASQVWDIAVSRSSAPTTLGRDSWDYYQVRNSEWSRGGNVPVITGLGYNFDALVFTTTTGTLGRLGVLSIGNDDLASPGTPSSLTVFRTAVGASDLQPAIMHDSRAGDPMWLITEAGDNNRSMAIVRMTNVLSNRPDFDQTNVPVTPYFGTATAPPRQPDGTSLAFVATIITSAAVSGDRLVAAHTVGTAARDRTLVRFYEFNLAGTAPTLTRQRDVDNADTGAGQANFYNYYPSIDINPAGDLGLTYVQSGTAAGEFVSTWVTGFTNGALETPVRVGAGTGRVNAPANSQQGATSSINVDTDGTFWATNSFLDVGSRRSSAVGRFTLGPASPLPRLVTLIGQKYDDLDGDGRKDAGEPGLPGWTIQLDVDDDGRFDAATTTGVDGSFRFQALAPPANDINVSQSNGSETEPTIAVDPTNPQRLFVASNENFLAQGLFAAYSTDGGVTWTRRFIADGNDNLPVGTTDPSAVFDRFGNLFLSYLDQNTRIGYVARSADGGQTFTTIVQFAASDYPTVTTGADSVWVSYQDTGGQIATIGARVTGPAAVGAFQGPFVIPNSANTNFADISIGPDGQVLVVFQDNPGDSQTSTLFTSFDADGLGAGQGFTGPIAVVTTNVGGFQVIPAQSRRTVYPDVGLAYDRSNGPNRGRVYLSYTARANTVSDNFDTDILLRSSDNDGQTWSNPVRVNDDVGGNSQFLARLAVDQSNVTPGAVALTWYDARNDVGNGSLLGDTDGLPNTDARVYGTVSIDGGATFVPNVPISAGTSNAFASPNPNEYGDYAGLTFHGGAFHAVWADNSNSTGDNPHGALDHTNIHTARASLLDAGTFRLREVLRPGYVQTSPAAPGVQTVTATNGQTVTGIDFGNFQLAAIAGRVFRDVNGNGVRDVGEPPLPGWTVFLNPGDTDGDGNFDAGDRATVSDAAGDYVFTGLAAGTYALGERLPANWRQTGPQPLPPATYSVRVLGVQSGERNGGNDFGNAPIRSTLSGRVFDDVNGDGVRGVTEPGLPGRVVYLDFNRNGVLDGSPVEPSLETDANGDYIFVAPATGAYAVRQVVPTGARQTTANPDDAVIANLIGQSVGGIDFGNFTLGAITGTVFEPRPPASRRVGGVSRTGGRGLPGWTVFVDLNGDGAMGANEPSAVSDPLGAYAIGELSAGTYTVREVLQPGFAQVFPAARFYTITIATSGAVVRGIDFGNTRSDVNALFGANLVTNGGGELGAGSASGSDVIRPISGGTPSGNFTVVSYAAGGGFPTNDDPGPTDRGSNFFSGGPSNASSSQTQRIDVSVAAGRIDGGGVMFTLSGFLGGFDISDDGAVLTAEFLAVGGARLGSASIGPVTAADRNDVTGLLRRTTTGAVPPGTFVIQLTLEMTRVDGSFNDGYADNLSLVLTETSAQVQFGVADFVIDEGDGQAIITVVRTGDLNGTSTVHFAVADGTARGGVDYGRGELDLTFEPGDEFVMVNVPLGNDNQPEGDETVLLTLSAPGGARLGTPASATLTIRDDDGTPTERFIAESYLRLLETPVDSLGLSSGTSFLNANPGPQGRELFGRILQATEQGRRVQLNRLYRQYIDRDVDEGGRVFWSNLINLGRVNIDQVGGFVISSQEFLNSVGGSANAFADSVVLRATGRARTSSDPAVPGNLLDTRLIDISGNGSIGAEDAGFTAGQLARFFYALSVNGGDGQRRLPDADRFSVTTYYALAGVAVDNDFNGFVNILQTLLFYPLDDDVVFARILAKRNS